MCCWKTEGEQTMAKDRNQQLPGMGREGVARGPVGCLGMTFPDDDARRAFFTEKLREKLQDSEFRKIDGFPKGEDEDILRMSDPPYYTACPNPFVGDFIQTWKSEKSSRSPTVRPPFATDITEGKGEHFYNVHTYHTKVPYRAIARFVLHYTQPGDVVLDPFCGTGMTGLAVQACADPGFVRELTQSPDPVAAGARHAVLLDLSPAATHIASNYNAECDADAFEHACTEILDDFKAECGWMFTTRDNASGEDAPVDYYVWSDIFACPACDHEIVFWNQGVDAETGHKRKDKGMICPSCGAENSRDNYRRVEESYFDDSLQTVVKKQKEQLVLVVYRVGKTVRQKEPDQRDLDILDQVARESIPDSVPVVRMMHSDEAAWGDMHRAGYHLGMTHFHHFYYRRSLRAFAWLWSRVHRADVGLRPRLRWWLQSVSIGFTRLNRYFSSSYSQVNRYLMTLPWFPGPRDKQVREDRWRRRRSDDGTAVSSRQRLRNLSSTRA
jgi:hypothetical protein